MAFFPALVAGVVEWWWAWLLTTRSLPVVCDPAALDMDETYELIISEGMAELNSNSVFGALRGIETLSQLVVRDTDGYRAPSKCVIKVCVSRARICLRHGLQ